MRELFIVNVEGAVVHEGRYLMVVRGPGESHAAGMLALIGGKVDAGTVAQDVLEATLQREIAEEVGVQVHDDMVYVDSKSFVADDGDPVVDIVFLCRYKAGTPTIGDPDEVAAVAWLSAAEILAHPQSPPWMASSIARVEQRRLALGW